MKDWDICETSFISFNLIMSERYQLLVHLKMNAHHLLILINFISRTENKLFWNMLQCFFVCKQWKSLELNVVFGPHWLHYMDKNVSVTYVTLVPWRRERRRHVRWPTNWDPRQRDCQRGTPFDEQVPLQSIGPSRGRCPCWSDSECYLLG